MSNIKDLTVISTDGASELSKSVASNFAQIEAMVESTTGVSITDLVKSKVSPKADTVKELDN